MIDVTRTQESSMDAVAPYPTHREADVVLRDGSVVHVRPVRATDGVARVLAASAIRGPTAEIFRTRQQSRSRRTRRG